MDKRMNFWPWLHFSLETMNPSPPDPVEGMVVPGDLGKGEGVGRYRLDEIGMCMCCVRGGDLS